MATQSMFTNPYDAQIAQQEAGRARALEVSKIPWYERGAYEGQMAGEDIGRGLGGMLGMQTPEDAKQAKIEEVMGQFGEGKKTPEQLMQIADSFRAAGMLDLWEEVMGMAKDMETTSKVTAAQQQNLADMDATLDFLEVSKGYKLNPKEAAYFKARIKKDVSLSMSGQVVDTAPNVFDQIISARKGGESSDGGIGDTGLTEAGLEKQVGDLATRVIKADLSGLDTAISQAEEMITSYKGKDIPGLSKMNVMERMTAEGSKNATRVKSVSNILMKLRSGAAVTESEAKRFSEEMSSAPIVTDELWIDWLSRLRLLVDERKRELYAGVPPEVIELYQSRQGKKKDKKSRTSTQAEQEILSKYNLK